MRILVTGREGQVVQALAEEGLGEGHEIIRLGRPEFDLAAPEGIRTALDRHRPDVVVSAAAYTAVDQAESEPDLAMAINGTAPGVIAAAAAERGLPIIHLSTDYVFDGLKPTPYVETDVTGPQGIYGRTKLAGEQAVAAANPRHVILRTAWVYAHGGKNFVRTMLRLAADRPELRVVSDQLGCPTYATDLARSILDISGKLAGAEAGDERFGLFHASGTGDTSWAGFASAIFELSARQGGATAQVTPIATADYPTPARRPANSRLSCNQIQRVYGIRQPHWFDGLSRCLGRLDQASRQ
jgi:dTDP-4-dehydrorhamnose reductase